MERTAADLVVVGAGVSGLTLAFRAARAGRKVLVLEREGRVGGCVHSHRRSDGFWFEMGAHTTYNSYGTFLDLVLGTGLRDRVVQRGSARATFGLLRGDDVRWLTPPKVLLELGWLEAALHLPLAPFRSRRAESLRSRFSRLVGPRNYDRVLSAFFAAVPSQRADGFPAEGPGSLFKKRPRREEFPRSFGIEGGLQTVLDAAAAFPGIAVERGAGVTGVARSGGGFSVSTGDGRTFEAPLAAVAATADEAARILREGFPALAAAVSRVRTVEVESLGVVLPRSRCWMPECAFVVPVGDLFFSAVTRDPFPDPERRAFAFHFRPGVPREEKLRRIARVLRVPEEDLGEPVEARRVLPAPEVGHGEIVREIDASLAGTSLALCGNYFAGLAIEDCALRSAAEWERISV